MLITGIDTGKLETQVYRKSATYIKSSTTTTATQELTKSAEYNASRKDEEKLLMTIRNGHYTHDYIPTIPIIYLV